MPSHDGNFYDSTSFATESLADWVFQQLKTYAAEEGKVAQVFADDGSSWTYEELLNHSVHVAAGLKGVGINPGDMVCFVARNSHELFAIALGCFMSDVTITPSIAELNPNELAQDISAVNAKFVIAGLQFIPSVQKAVSTLNPKPQIFEVKQLFKDTTAKGAKFDPAVFKPVHIADSRSHVLACLFSSGTTGKQKAVALVDYGVIRTADLASRFQSDLKDANGIIINASQMHWVSWWLVLVRSLCRGWTRIFLDRNRPEDVLDAINKFKPFVIVAQPSLLFGMAREMEKKPRCWDISSLLCTFMVGDVVNKVAHELLASKMKVPIFQEYGSTEAGFVLQGRVNSPVVYGSAGKPLMPLKLVDEQTGKEITEPNNPGEIVVKWMEFQEYLNNPEDTANTFDENGWLKMGDIALFDESGNYFIVDRAKEMFKYRNFQVAPSELESIIQNIPGVQDVGVVGKPAGAEIGDLPTAFVVKSPGSSITEKDIIDYVEKENVHDSKRLRGGVIFAEEIPRNVNGKLVRSKLKAILT